MLLATWIPGYSQKMPEAKLVQHKPGIRICFELSYIFQVGRRFEM